MGWRERWARIRAGREIQIGDVATPWDGNLAPSIVAKIAAGTSDLFGYGCGAVSREVALSVPAVRRGVRLMTTAIGSMPLVPWARNERQEAPPFLTQPEAGRTYVQTMTRTVEDLIFYPYAWWAVVRRDVTTGRPLRVVRISPDLVTVERDPATGQVIDAWTMLKNTRVPYGDLIRFDGPDEGFLLHGAGAVLTALRLELAATRYASPEIPTGYLKNSSEYDLTEDEADTLLDKWEAARRLRATAYLNRAVDYVNPQGNAKDLQLVEAREESALQIARALNLAPKYCDATSGDSMTYTNVTAERQDLIDFTLRSYIEPIEQRLSESDRNGTPLGTRVRFNMDTFLRGDPSGRAALYQTLIPLGVMSVDEARALENLTGAPSRRPSSPDTDALGDTVD